MSYLAKIISSHQKETLKLIAPAAKKTLDFQHLEDLDSEAENAFVAATLTQIRSKTTLQNNTPLVSRNRDNYKFNIIVFLDFVTYI